MGADLKGPEGIQPKNIEAVEKEISDVQRQIEGAEAGIKIEGQTVASLMKNLGNPNDIPENERTDARITFSILQNAKGRLGELELQKVVLESKNDIPNKDDGEVSSIDNEAFNIMTNREFLSQVDGPERLKYITKPMIKSQAISNGTVKEMTFNFPNKELYMLTTAGQVIPQEVSEVSVGGENFTRINNSLKGEFYNNSNQRLKIHGGGFGGADTNVSVEKLRGNDEITKLTSEYDEVLKKYEGAANKLTAKEALEKGIDVKTFIIIIDRRFENAEELQKNHPQDFSIRLEEYSTEVLRVMSQNKEVTTSEEYSVETSAEIFKRLTPASWEKSVLARGFTQENIDTYNKAIQYNEYSFAQDYEGNIPGEFVSNPAEKSSSGTTLCSKTARLNLYKLGIPYTAVATGSSALNAFNSIKSNMTVQDNFSNLEGKDGDIADIYLDASSVKNRKYGHRAAAQNIDGNWFVLDPYLPVLGRKTTGAIPLEQYTAYQHDRGRKMWGAKIFAS